VTVNGTGTEVGDGTIWGGVVVGAGVATMGEAAGVGGPAVGRGAPGRTDWPSALAPSARKIASTAEASPPILGRHSTHDFEALAGMARCIVLVLDSGGIGALPDAGAYGDAPGANTLANVAERSGGLRLPTCGRLGLGNLTGIRGVPPAEHPAAYVARLAERSKGKDTITGHWEMTGVTTAVPFPTYPNGFPPEVVAAFAEITGQEPLGNVPASGTEIIERLGEEHARTGRPILYTSADSVFQVAAHEEVVPLEVLYDWCAQARAMLVPPHQVNRVIARPFTGAPGAYERTPNRRDFAIPPPPNALDELAAAGIPVLAVGKISDIFCGRGIAGSVRSTDNEEGMDRTVGLLPSLDRGLIFVNLNDFDSKYGHRRDVRGYAEALQRFDARLEGLLAMLRPGEDMLVISADHGCDPTAPGSDHTREYVPYVEFGARRGFAGTIDGLDIVGRTVMEALGTAAVSR
jgi:phosphopentomutase